MFSSDQVFSQEHLFHSRVAEASVAPLGVRQLLGQSKRNGLVFVDDHLGDPVAVLDGEVLLAPVDHGHPEFAPVVGIDGADAVDEADAVLLDAAQMPLIIAGSPRVQSNMYKSADFFVRTLKRLLVRAISTRRFSK